MCIAMLAHSREQFEVFMSQLLDTNATLDFYCDFDKIRQNVEEISISLNTLNYLIGKEDLDTAIELLWRRDKSVFEVLEILIAVRSKDRKKVVNARGAIVPIKDYLTTLEGVKEYIYGTGLAQVFKNRDIKNLVDYVFGVEAGLDTHARKNRSGHAMEGLIADIFTSHGVRFAREVYSTDFPDIHSALEGDTKRFDFVVKTRATTYLIETNFYSSGGSKPNEVARAYTELAQKIDAVEGYTFVWITDGVGWHKAKAMIEAAYSAIPNVYNITDLKDFVSKIKQVGQ